ncbi:hypothetical protein K2173_024383 [Erythroxylum novogranatense]|uniref:Cytochrome P450 n=1 Tax=Erythroxylum novogranatense TaxID=1862640 RepID=A0AAV8SV87_9ROSI|nr:hypothetical protein K2173_024383 [Erythroxylum novogranatense]
MSSLCKAWPISVVYLLLNKSEGCDSLEASRFLRDYALREFNALLWVSLIALSALSLEKVFKLFRLWAVARSIPGPPCRSFFGHGGFGSRDEFIDLLSESHNKYGSICKLWMGPTQLLVSVKDPTLIKEMLLKAEDKLPFIGKAFRLAFGRSNLFFCSYDQAKKRRESLVLELNEKLHGRSDIVPNNVVDCIMDKIDNHMSNGCVNNKLISQHMAFTMLGATLFGDAFIAWSKASSYEELIMMIAKDASFWASYRVTPFWERGYWRYQSLCTKLRCLTQDIVKQCTKNCRLFCNMERSTHNGDARNGTKEASVWPNSGILMQEKFLSRELDDHLNLKEETCGNVMGVMFHGWMATASLIETILERLVKDPEIQDKIYAEIIMVRQGSKGPDVHKMFLLLATIYESARLLPGGPLLQRCSLKNDLNLNNDVTIPAGSVLVVPVQLLQTDDASWGSNADKFNPYRFLSGAGKVSTMVEKGSLAGETDDPNHSSVLLNNPSENAAYLPFGSGTRACVGQTFVIQGVATLLASLLERYKVRLQVRSVDGSKTASPEIVFVRRNC